MPIQSKHALELNFWCAECIKCLRTEWGYSFVDAVDLVEKHPVLTSAHTRSMYTPEGAVFKLIEYLTFD